VLVEDQANYTQVISDLIDSHPRQAELVLTTLSNGRELEEYLKRGGMVDVALMDIMLGEGEPTGIDLVRRFFPAGSAAQIIYLSKHIEYCTEVYRTEHVYFLMKPLDREEFDFALDKALASVEASRSRALIVHSKGTIRRVDPARICYLESDRRKVSMHLMDETIQTYASIGKMADSLPKCFFQCHKSFLVNMNYIVELKKDCVLMASGEKVPVSQKRRKQMKDAFLDYIQNGI